MKKSTLTIISILAVIAYLLSACGNKVIFEAPEIEPPADLVPGYLPEGSVLLQGYQINPGDLHLITETGDGQAVIEKPGLIGDPIFSTKSPKGNSVTGIAYRNQDQLILITKSSFPGGTLEEWRKAFESYWSEDCECPCFDIHLDIHEFRSHLLNIKEERMVGDTPVIILEGLMGTTSIFMRGTDLLAIESGISLEENLKIVESLLQN